MGGNALLLGSFVYFSVEANNLESDYLKATEPAEISSAYNKYNQAYQNRNYALAGFIALWLFTQIDFLFISDFPSPEKAISWSPYLDNRGRSSLIISYRF